MDIVYKKISVFNRGILLELLKDTYAYNREIEKTCSSDWQNCDNFFFNNMQIADQCGFITTQNDEAIGFISWDPRQLPEYVEIGQNCIMTKYKGLGFGKAQLQEAVNRIIQNGAKRIIAKTDSGLIPAQRMYESVGFAVYEKRKKVYESGSAGEDIYYEYVL